MAKLRAGILGPVSGKVGDIVGASWKGINYIRQYVIPGNPNTALQQTERGLFAEIVGLASACLGPILQPFCDPFLRANSAWADFIGRARDLMAASGDFSPVQLTRGTLEGTLIGACVYGTPTVDFTWSDTVLGNGSATDDVGLFVYDRVNKVGFFDHSQTRTDGAGMVTVGAGRTAAEMDAWLFLVDDKTDPTKISYTDYSVVS